METEEIIEKYRNFNYKEKQIYGSKFIDKLMAIYREKILSNNSVILITTREEKEIYALITSFMFPGMNLRSNDDNIFQAEMVGCDFLDLVDKKIYYLKDLLPIINLNEKKI